MIVVGFPGIGKSTLSRDCNGYYLDLESSMFVVNRKKIDNWQIPYVRTAEYLSRKGFWVFVSSHKEVSEELKNCSEIVVMCYPSIDLESEWIHRLEERYSKSHLTKDERALTRAKSHFRDDIMNMQAMSEEFQFPAIVIHSMDYNLKDELEGWANL